jgi:magnesium transporter
MIAAYCHTRDHGWKPVGDLTLLSDLRTEAGKLLWVEADARRLDDDKAATLAEEFGLRLPVVEDAAQARRARPKLDLWDDLLFLVLHQLDEVSGQLEAVQLTCFVGGSFVLTIHEGAERTLEEAKRRWADIGKEHDEGPAYLVHTLLDVIVDDYERIAGALEEEMEELEEIALEVPTAPLQRQLYGVKQRLARVRRYGLPIARVLESLDNPSGRLGWPQATAPLFRDVYEHVLRLGDEVRSIDELSQAVIELQRSELATRLSDVNKKLTAWAAIVAVPTFIASLYGMNFALWPPTGSSSGFIFALALMATVAAGLYVSFKRRRWL